jgi:aspartate oxidase
VELLSSTAIKTKTKSKTTNKQTNKQTNKFKRINKQKAQKVFNRKGSILHFASSLTTAFADLKRLKAKKKMFLLVFLNEPILLVTCQTQR